MTVVGLEKPRQDRAASPKAASPGLRIYGAREGRGLSFLGQEDERAPSHLRRAAGRLRAVMNDSGLARDLKQLQLIIGFYRC